MRRKSKIDKMQDFEEKHSKNTKRRKTFRRKTFRRKTFRRKTFRRKPIKKDRPDTRTDKDKKSEKTKKTLIFFIEVNL